jgi:chitinase
MIFRSLQYLRLASLSFIGLMAAVSVPSAPAQQTLPNNLTKRVVADYVYWSKYQTPAYGAPQIPYHMLTHINHAGVSFDATGTLSVPSGPGNEFLEPELNNLAHAKGVKVLLLLGGDFPGLEASGEVQTLVDNLAAFETEHHYDGVDLDWEYPETSGDHNFLLELVKKLRESNADYVISIDAAPWGGYAYNLKNLPLYVDYINIMMYDCAGPWTAHGQLNSAIFWDNHDPAPYECQPGGSVHDTANIFLKEVPGAQLNMGTPFYGYHYHNINQLFGLCPNAAFTVDGECDGTVTSGNYFPDFKPLINKRGWETLYDPIALVPYMLRVDGSDGYITYDDAFSTYYRVWYSDWERGLGGTFMWSLDADYDGHSQDLMVAMYNASLKTSN